MKKNDETLAEIQQLLTKHVLDGLRQIKEGEPVKASFLQVALSLLKANGSLEDIPSTPAEALAAAKQLGLIPKRPMPFNEPPFTNPADKTALPFPEAIEKTAIQADYEKGDTP
jgi:hypothetical protein